MRRALLCPSPFAGLRTGATLAISSLALSSLVLSSLGFAQAFPAPDRFGTSHESLTARDPEIALGDHTTARRLVSAGLVPRTELGRQLVQRVRTDFGIAVAHRPGLFVRGACGVLALNELGEVLAHRAFPECTSARAPLLSSAEGKLYVAWEERFTSVVVQRLDPNSLRDAAAPLRVVRPRDRYALDAAAGIEAEPAGARLHYGGGAVLRVSPELQSWPSGLADWWRYGKRRGRLWLLVGLLPLLGLLSALLRHRWFLRLRAAERSGELLAGEFRPEPEPVLVTSEGRLSLEPARRTVGQPTAECQVLAATKEHRSAGPFRPFCSVRPRLLLFGSPPAARRALAHYRDRWWMLSLVVAGVLSFIAAFGSGG
ncbi:MAG: hypothetical protein AAGF12_02205 [Myxococcota bacterium]